MKKFLILMVLLSTTGCFLDHKSSSLDEDGKQDAPEDVDDNSKKDAPEEIIKFNSNEILKSDESLYESFKNGLIKPYFKSECMKIHDYQISNLKFEDEKYIQLEVKINLNDKEKKLNGVDVTVKSFTEEKCFFYNMVLGKSFTFDVTKKGSYNDDSFFLELSFYSASAFLSEKFYQRANDVLLYGYNDWSNDREKNLTYNELFEIEKIISMIHFEENNKALYATNILFSKETKHAFDVFEIE